MYTRAFGVLYLKVVASSIIRMIHIQRKLSSVRDTTCNMALVREWSQRNMDRIGGGAAGT